MISVTSIMKDKDHYRQQDPFLLSFSVKDFFLVLAFLPVFKKILEKLFSKKYFHLRIFTDFANYFGLYLTELHIKNLGLKRASTFLLQIAVSHEERKLSSVGFRIFFHVLLLLLNNFLCMVVGSRSM